MTCVGSGSSARGGHVALQLGGGDVTAAAVLLGSDFAGLDAFVERRSADLQDAGGFHHVESNLRQVLGR